MRQRITVVQLQSLSPEQQEKLREWWQPKQGDFYVDCVWEMKHIVSSYHVDETIVDVSEEIDMKKDCLPLLSIGQCIQLLEYKLKKIEYGKNYYVYANINTGNNYELIYKEELIDALFEAVKAVL